MNGFDPNRVQNYGRDALISFYQQETSLSRSSLSHFDIPSAITHLNATAQIVHRYQQTEKLGRFPATVAVRIKNPRIITP